MGNLQNLKSHHLNSIFSVLTPELSIKSIENSQDIYENLNKEFDQFKNHTLISCHDFSSSWGTWECHPHGDELVVLISGKVTFTIQIDQERLEVQLSNSGESLIIPKGLWHTASTDCPSKVLFITPGEATEHSSQPG